ncbi:PAS domain-containing protein [Altererythrobacter aquiaggeris]|uniref:PAS domain-containing protein n=1 Tax=Aestuarierythrobacter aquiaggeris TaxID=1898396 RepID=UPI0030164400
MASTTIPGKSSPTAQVMLQIDQRGLDTSPNHDPATLRIDPARLFTQATEQTRMALCISDPFAADEPIVYVNQAFVELTGYSRQEIVGRNCRFLQGEKTDPDASGKIRKALEECAVAVVDILNYRKDGSAFWNALHVGPIFAEDGSLAYFYGSQWDITDIIKEREDSLRQIQVNKELQHRTDNLFAVIQAIVSMTARGETDADQLAQRIGERIEALSIAHRASLKAGSDKGRPADLGGLVRAIMKPYRGGADEQVNLTGGDVPLPPATITPLGLALHELATNAVKYGALSVPEGSVCIDWAIKNGELIICWTEQNGPVIKLTDGEPEINGGGNGSRMVKGMLRGLGGRVEMTFDPKGLDATIHLPLPEDTAD